MSRNARLIGLEGRTIVTDLIVADGTREIRMPCFNGAKLIGSDPEDYWPTRFDEIVYRFDFEAEDGTLIYRRVTPLWRDR